MNKVEEILTAIKSRSLPITTEKELQVEIEKLLIEKGIDHQREYRLDKSNIVDFFIDGIAVEVKIKSPAKKMYRQCERYCQFDEVEALILLTSRTTGFPEEINNKPCYVHSLGMQWL